MWLKFVSLSRTKNAIIFMKYCMIRKFLHFFILFVSYLTSFSTSLPETYVFRILFLTSQAFAMTCYINMLTSSVICICRTGPTTIEGQVKERKLQTIRSQFPVKATSEWRRYLPRHKSIIRGNNFGPLGR